MRTACKLSCALAAMLALATPSHASVISTTNLTIITAPSIVGSDFLSNQNLPSGVVFNEKQNVTLTSPLVTDTGIIPAGTVVDSQFFAVQSLVGASLASSATFDGNVLGVVYMDFSSNWTTSDFLGAPGTTYLEDPAVCPDCGFEPGQDSLTVSGKTVDFRNSFSEPGDMARIVTAAAPSSTPEPTSVLLAGVGFLLLFRRRRS